MSKFQEKFMDSYGGWQFFVIWRSNLKFWNMALYTIYESGGEIYELNDAGESGGNIGVSSHFEVFRSMHLEI